MLCGDLNGKEIQKEGMLVYVELIHFALLGESNSIVKQLYYNKN